MSKVLQFTRNAETAAADDWRAVASPLAELILTADHLRCDMTPDGVLMTLATIANHAGNAMTLNRQVLKSGYQPALDDSIAALGGRILATVPDLVGRVHIDYVRFMLASCDALLLACSHRRAARQPAQAQAQAQRMERAA